MSGEINFGLVDPDSMLRGVRATNELLKGFASVRAGRALAQGNISGAQSELYKHGLLEEGLSVGAKAQAGRDQTQKSHWAEDDRVRKLELEKQKESATFTAEASSALYSHMKQHATDQDGGKSAVLAGFDQLAPILAQRGAPPETIATFRDNLAKDPETFLNLLHSQATSHLKQFSLSEKQVRYNEDGEVVARGQPSPETKIVRDGDGTQHVVRVYPEGQEPDAPPTQGPVPSESNAEAFDPDTVTRAVIAAGGKMTSGIRSPEKNREVHGVDNSFHLAERGGLGRDFTPPEGVSLGRLHAAIKQAIPGDWQAIQEKDHVHIEPGPDSPQAHAGKAASAEHPLVKELWAGAPKPPTATALKVGGAAGKAAKLSQSEEAGLQKLRQSNTEAQNMASLTDRFVSLNKQIKTGGTMALPGMGDVIGTVNPKVSEMVAITSQLTPAMRNGLPGAASDKDVAMFKSATVGINKPYAANVAIARAAKAFASRQGDYLAFLEAWANSRGTVRGASEVWKGYADSHPVFSGVDKNGVPLLAKSTPWRQAIQMDGSAPQPATRERVWDAAKGGFVDAH